jgi:hypothetical protein
MEKRQRIGRLFVPPDEQASKTVHPGMRSFYHPTACFEASFPFDRLGLFSPWTNVGRKAKLVKDVAHLLVVIALVSAHPLGVLLARLRPVDDDTLDAGAHQLHVMALRPFNHEADWDSLPLREQAAFHPAFAAIARMGPGFFPHLTGRMAHRSIHREPVPIDPAEFLKLLDACLPQLEEDARIHPLLKAIVRRRMRTQLRLIEGLPLASGAQDREDRVGTVSIGHARSSTSKAMRVHMQRQQRLQYCPQLIGNPESCRRTIIRRSLPFSFLGLLFVHTS